MPNKKPTLTGYFYLIATTFFWGTTFVFSKTMLGYLDPFSYLFWRYFIAFLPLIPFLRLDKKAILDGFWLSITNAIALITQFIALTTINASTAAFIVSLSIPLTPALEMIWLEKKQSATVTFGQVLSVVGFLALSYLPGERFTISVGAFLMLISALAYTIQFVLIPKMNIHSQLNTSAYMIGFTALWSLPFTRMFAIPRPALSPLLYLALVATTLTIWLQLQGQKDVSATTAAYIFAFEPIFAYVFAHIVRGENLTSFGNVGAFLIFLSAFLVQYGEYRTNRAALYASASEIEPKNEEQQP
ncbi:DMT family transporter [Coprothermobacter platensis]|uniref:DMT family transporter n=1 Tax=Coprothermobacter platensis TaxID=108819 RepID=UPI00036216C2|nr:DMT family transporter [Coprothermobacter platensis]